MAQLNELLDKATSRRLMSDVPDDLKRHGSTGKYLLKRVMRGKLPDAIIDRPKKGFGLPLSAWLRGALRPMCEELLDPARLQQECYFNAAYVHRSLRWLARPVMCSRFSLST